MELFLIQGLTLLLFTIGLYGVMTAKTGIKTLISIEILLNSALVNLVALGYRSSQPLVLALFVIAISVVESAVGLSIMLAVYRKFGRITIQSLREMRD
ncbi:MAG: NADH-quinone oxidoreductase subunit NuoK [Candidatus Thermoplasmatota archaeon]|nr:NADH-quinone oxidoreductase subunit NuoK [Candidatus Thermoplasmatota archaeon]MCL5731745.1 NADH-quinone oxidoreductase subunit NuoK [Candidatus Thermoplasmatota archaeon]